MHKAQRAKKTMICLSLLPLFSWGAEETHGTNLIENIELHVRAQDCDPESKLCINLKRKARRAGCYPPIVTWSSYGSDPEIVQAKVKVNAAGSAKDIKLVRRSKFAELDQAVIVSLSQCQMGVVESGGVAKESEFDVEFTLHPDKTAVRLVE